MKLSAFDILGVELLDSDESIKAAYLNKVKQNPPDLKPEQFKIIRQAFDCISNAEVRANYQLFDKPVIGLKEYFNTVLATPNIENDKPLFSDDLFNDLIKEAIDV